MKLIGPETPELPPVSTEEDDNPDVGDEDELPFKEPLVKC